MRKRPMANKKKTMAGRERFRLWFMALWFALTNGYLKGWTQGRIYQGESKKICVPGLNCYSCPGARFACPIGSLQAVLGSGAYRYSLYVFGLMAAFGVVLGRFICGWLCPFGLVQELLHKIPLPDRMKRKNLPGHRYLIWLKYLVLAVLVLFLPMAVKGAGGLGTPWFCKYLCPSGTLFAGLPLVALQKPLQAAAGLLFNWKVLVLAVVLALSVIVYRPFCKYLCPLGAFYGFFNKISLCRLEADRDKCIRCGKCREACGMDIKVWEDPSSMECIRCGRCKHVCPTGAITSASDRLRGGGKRQEAAEQAEGH